MYYPISELKLLAEGAISPSELNEVTKFKKYDMYNSDAAKALSAKLKEADRETNEKKQQAMYKEALSMAKSLKAKAAKIPSNDFGDWVIDLLIKPWWWLLGDVVATAVNGDDIRDMSQSQAMAHFDRLIKKIERQID